jgi:hypothetical protein
LATAACRQASTVSLRFDAEQDDAARVQSDAQQMSADPQAFLRDTLTRCQALLAYEVNFKRQERRGMLAKTLQKEEHFAVRFRAEPLSIYMEMLDPESTYDRAAYMAGHHDDQLHLRHRPRTADRPPRFKFFPPSVAVRFGFSLGPITRFGVANVMTRVLTVLDEANAAGLSPTISYHESARHEVTGAHVHHLRLIYDPSTGLPRGQVDLQFDTTTLLPVGCYAWLRNGDLDAKYIFSELDSSVDLSDDQFLLN